MLFIENLLRSPLNNSSEFCFNRPKLIYRKNKTSCSLKCTRTCAFQEVRNISFANVSFTNY